jgi:hypothetical protein
METGTIVSEIHARDETEENKIRDQEADLLRSIIYLTPVFIGWGVIVLLIGIYGFADSSSDKQLQTAIVILGASLMAIGMYARYSCKKKLDAILHPSEFLWTP